eukprot:UN18760
MLLYSFEDEICCPNVLAYFRLHSLKFENSTG